MHMTLWWNYNLGDFMFKGLAVNTVLSLSVTCLAMCALAVAFEGAKWVLAIMQKASNRQILGRSSDERRNLLQRGNGEAGPSHSQVPAAPATPSIRRRCAYHVRQALLYLLHNLTSFILMMAVMLYNGYLIIAITLGLTLGFFLFGPRMISLQMECHRPCAPVCSPECDDNVCKKGLCALELCQGAMCRERGVEMRDNATQLPNKPETSTPPLLHTSIDSSNPSTRFTCESRACLLPKNRRDSDETLSHEDSPPTCHYGAKECPAKIAVARRKSGQKNDQISNENCKKKSILVQIESCSSAVPESSLPEVDAQLLQTRTKNTKLCCGKSANSSNTEEFDTSLTVVLDDSKAIDSCCSREEKVACNKTSNQAESDSSNVDVLPHVKHVINTESECERL